MHYSSLKVGYNFVFETVLFRYKVAHTDRSVNSLMTCLQASVLHCTCCVDKVMMWAVCWEVHHSL